MSAVLLFRKKEMGKTISSGNGVPDNNLSGINGDKYTDLDTGIEYSYINNKWSEPAGSVSSIPNPIVFTYSGNLIIKSIEDLGESLTIEKRYRYYSGGSAQDGSLDIVEIKNSKTNQWIRSTYIYTNGKLTSMSNEIITSWTI